MLQNTWYTVISPESCSSILWRSWEKKEIAAEQLKLTPEHMQQFGLIDGIVPEPAGGAHWDYDLAGQLLKKELLPILQQLKSISPEERINSRIERYSKMGFWDGL